MIFTKEQRKNAYQKLPEKLQDFISDPESSNKTDSIASKFNLSIDKSNILYDETLLLLMGLETENEFTTNLQTKLSVNEKIAVEIYYEVNENILKDIKNLIPKIDTNNIVAPTPEAKDILLKNLGGNSKTQNEPLLPQGNGLIENGAGNRDNIIPPIIETAPIEPAHKVVNLITPVPTPIPTPTPFISQPIVNIPEPKPAEVIPTPVPFAPQVEASIVDQKLNALSENPKAPDQIVARQYVDKPDPYREPIS
jgi:hypothetical protein